METVINKHWLRFKGAGKGCIMHKDGYSVYGLCQFKECLNRFT